MCRRRWSAALSLLVAALLSACQGAPAPDSTRPATLAPSSEQTLPPSPDATASPARRTCRHPCRRKPTTVGRFGLAAAPEASGLAASRRNPGLLYVLDDGPGTTSLLVIRASDARRVGRLHVAGLEGVDTESLAVGGCAGAGRWCIYIGDIGDNLGQREAVEVIRIPEPDLGRGVPNEPVTADPIALRYPDEPIDAEALLVDRRGTIGIVAKSAGRGGRGSARFYVAGTFADQVLKPAGRLRLPQPRSPLISAVLGNVVTGGDATDGRVVLRTYDAVYEFTAPADGAPLPTLAKWSVREIPAGIETQGEAIAYAADGCGLFTVSEGSARLTASTCK